jgi:hypothetical protein
LGVCVVLWAIAVVFRRMSPALRLLGLPGGTDRNRILESAHTVVGEYLRVNYAGDPGQLATALNGLLPQLRDVVDTNYCDIGFVADRDLESLIVGSALDNLTKGAAGQAIQNFNLMFGFPETTGLRSG